MESGHLFFGSSSLKAAYKQSMKSSVVWSKEQGFSGQADLCSTSSSDTYELCNLGELLDLFDPQVSSPTKNGGNTFLGCCED